MTDLATSTSWFRVVDRSQWRTLIAANLGWLFDGFETYALVLTAGPALSPCFQLRPHGISAQARS
jgi:hypothetical protein